MSWTDYILARKYFLEHDERCRVWEEKGIKWVMHHKDPSWRHNDEERYEQWNVEDLLPMTVSAHGAIHGYKERNPNYGKHHTLSYETRRRMSESHPDTSGKNNPMYGKPGTFLGKHHTEKSKKKMSENHADVSGKNNPMYGRHYHWYNNGTECTRATECPEGYVPGRIIKRK